MSPLLASLMAPVAAGLCLLAAAVAGWRYVRLRAAYEELQRVAENNRMALNGASDGLVIEDERGCILWMNSAYCRLMGRSAEEMRGRNPMQFAFPPDKQPRPEEIDAFHLSNLDAGDNRLMTYENVRPDGTRFWNQISMSVWRNTRGQLRAVVCCRDVTEEVEARDRLMAVRSALEEAASTDHLTGLSNRAGLMDRIGRLSSEGKGFGLLHLDLDRFKSVNDTHGHAAGDAVLRHVADAIRRGVREGDLACRLGGDEFVILCEGGPDLATLTRVGEGVLAAIRKPIEHDGAQLLVEASCGAALSSGADRDGDRVMTRADFALYEAKRRGRNLCVPYDRALHDSRKDKRDLAADLAETIESEGMDYVFQPVFDLVEGTVSGFETLIRWDRGEAGVLGPGEFLPLVEEMGLLGQLDLQGMDNALDMRGRLRQAGHLGYRIGFNASPELLSHPDFIPRLVLGTEMRNLARNKVVIEVLETTVFEEGPGIAGAADVIRDLREAGFQVYLDDFGVGYAGLSHLARLDVTGVKIDRSLVRDLCTSHSAKKIVGTIIDLCHDLGLDLIAEGVEDAETAALLRRLGCAKVQGYWIARPIPQAYLMSWLEGENRRGIAGLVHRWERLAS